MRQIRTFGRFWYDFVVGDDWRIAVGVVAAVAATVLAHHHGLDWWWLVPASAVALLAYSLMMVTRAPQHPSAPSPSVDSDPTGP